MRGWSVEFVLPKQECFLLQKLDAFLNTKCLKCADGTQKIEAVQGIASSNKSLDLEWDQWLVALTRAIRLHAGRCPASGIKYRDVFGDSPFARRSCKVFNYNYDRFIF
jgi:hypothetical protein